MITTSTKATPEQKIRLRLIDLGTTYRAERTKFLYEIARLAREMLPYAHKINAWAPALFDPKLEMSLPLPDPYGQEQTQFCQLYRERRIVEVCEAIAQIKARARGPSKTEEEGGGPSLTVPQLHNLFAVHLMTSVDPRLAVESAEWFSVACTVPTCLAMYEVITAEEGGRKAIGVRAERIVASMEHWLSMPELL
jgi:hypothetical protein